jgi:hypothetical protein
MPAAVLLEALVQEDLEVRLAETAPVGGAHVPEFGLGTR